MNGESRIISKTNEEWKQELTKEQYEVCRLRKETKYIKHDKSCMLSDMFNREKNLA